MRWLHHALLAAAIVYACIGCGGVELPASSGSPASSAPDGRVGFLIVAPDRGFLGNDEIRDAAESLGDEHPIQILFVTDERTDAELEARLGSLRAAGASAAVLVPLFVSAHHPQLARVLGRVAEVERRPLPLPIRVAPAFGTSYLAAELLGDRLREIDDPPGAHLVVLGHGATDAASRRAMEADLGRLTALAAEGFGFASQRAIVAPRSPDRAEAARALKEALREAADGAERVVVVPLHLGPKLDSMMSFAAGLPALLPPNARLLAGDLTPDPLVSLWMKREMNRALPARPGEVGVVLLAHGADHHWNETMRAAAEPLADRYLVEPAFSMADQPVVERAIRRLEARGARAIVVVRIFGLRSSFQGDVERMIGADVEAAWATGGGHGHHAGGRDHTGDEQHEHGPSHGGHGGHGHGGHGHAPHQVGPPPRIRAAAMVATAGGLEAHELFARALLERAREISSEPARETVILVAHGAGEDARNEHWLSVLEELATRMRAAGGDQFRAIRAGTWREDWPAKRAPWVEAIRAMVAESRHDGGRALVIPARTTGQGPEPELLEGLEFELGRGFAPHPLFVQWLEEQVLGALAAPHTGAVAAARASHRHHH